VLTGRASSTNVTTSTALTGLAPNIDIFIFARNQDGLATGFSNARFTFYSIGESLDLARLDARVTDLINAIGAAF